MDDCRRHLAGILLPWERSQYGGSPKQLLRWEMKSGAFTVCERPGMRTA